uniref:Uncharacterized protein n=1 Tax=viral metagenome TaxID=1070528 RepID=A0A6M3L0S5_9ZZZZ
MQLQTVNRDDAEATYGNFTNVQGATITTGYAVCFTTTAASANGNNAVLPAANNIRTFAGISMSDVADNAVGRYQAYGYNGSVFYFAEATSVSVTAGGHAAGPNASSLGVGYTGLSTAFGPVIILASLGAIVRSAGGYITGFIRAM